MSMTALSGIPTLNVKRLVGYADTCVGNIDDDAAMVEAANAQPYGAKLKELRTKRGLTQAAVADAVGIGRSTLASIETGHDGAGLATLLALADFYNVSKDWLTEGYAPPCNPERRDLVDDPDELAFLDMWRAFNDAERALALRMLKAIGESDSNAA